MKLVVCALTSSDPLRLNRLIQSVKNQRASDFEVTGIVVCNTKSETYPMVAKSIAEEHHWAFYQTESNGKPGKGKNSALDVFNTYYADYDYLLLMDGDDFLYEMALQQIQRIVERTHCDVLGLQTNDVLDFKLYPDTMRLDVPYKDRIMYLYSWFDKQYNIYGLPDQYGKVDRVNNRLGKHSTPDRIVLFSHAAAKTLRCSEELPVYEDYVLSLHAQAEYIQGRLKYVNSSSTFIYIYDKTGETSTCKQYDKDVKGDWGAHEQVFLNDIAPLDPILGDFHAAEVPFIFVPMPKLDNLYEYKQRNALKYMAMLG
jgi:hypothetical protein